MPEKPVIVRATYVPASYWNFIEWEPLDPDVLIIVRRSPPFPGGDPVAQDKTWFTDQRADPKIGYTYTVCASLGGESACSDPVSLQPSPVSEPAKPAAPAIVKITPTIDSIEIVWQATQTFSSYNVIWGRDGGPEQQVDIHSRGVDGSWKATNLQPDTMYHFRVEGCVGGLVGCSNWSPDYHVRTSALPPPVASVSAQIFNWDSVKITWTGVPGATGAELSRYRDGSHVPEETIKGLSGSGAYTETHLPPGVYWYGIASLSGGRSYGASSNQIVITLNPAPPAPPNFPALPFSPLSSASWGSDRIDLVYAGAGHDINRQAWDVDQWLPALTSWQALGDWTTGSPVVVATPPIGATTFVLGKDQQVYAKSVAGGYAPQDWEPLGGNATTVPAGISASPGRLDVFIVGQDHQIYQKIHLNGNWLPSQTDWLPLGGYSIYPPVAISSGPGRIDLFIAGADQAIYGKTWDGNAWLPSVGGWSRINGTIIGPPAAISWGPGRIDLLVVGTDSSVYQKTWDGGRWLPSNDGWQALGGKVLGPPALASWNAGRLDIFVVGTDKNVYHKAWDGSQWIPSQEGWDAVGGTVYNDPLSVAMPTSVSWGPGRLDLFVMGTDKAVYQKTLVPNGWIPANGWVAHGGQVQVGN